MFETDHPINLFFQAEEIAEERRGGCQQRLEERRRFDDSMVDDSTTRMMMDSDSLLGSIGSEINLPTLSLHCHCQQLMRERGEGGGGLVGEGGEVEGGEEFVSLSSTERLIEF